MKNIHVIPSRKPIGIHFLDYHITSSEQIKQGDWCIYNSGEVIQYLVKVNTDNLKKIILTTDQDLIKEGVQAIDDEFLEWFVKNPSCEEINVKHKDVVQYGNMTMYDHNGDGSHYSCKDCEVETSRSKEELLKFGVEYYKIIIPKEEPKQELPQLGTKEFNELASAYFGGKPKQETLEEAAENHHNIFTKDLSYAETRRESFKEGAKWQKEKYTIEEQHIERSLGELEKAYIKGFNEGAAWQAERMYSDFDVMDALHSVELKDNKNYTKIYNGMKEWFDQNKKQKG